MKPAAFDYACPDGLDEVLTLLAEHGEDARILAGGQSLMAMLNMRLAAPEVLIDISRLDSLRSISVVDDALQVGAAVTQNELLLWPQLMEIQPLLARAMPWVGHYQTRQKGTVCGSIVHSDPSAELPLVIKQLHGDIVIEKKGRKRTVSAAEFQIGMMATDLAPDEMVTACRFPIAASDQGHAFREVSQRHGDFALVALASTASSESIRLTAGGIAEVPTAIDLPRLTGDALDDALNDFAWQLGGSDDAHASARYRRELVRRIGRQVIEEACDALP